MILNETGVKNFSENAIVSQVEFTELDKEEVLGRYTWSASRREYQGIKSHFATNSDTSVKLLMNPSFCKKTVSILFVFIINTSLSNSIFFFPKKIKLVTVFVEK